MTLDWLDITRIAYDEIHFGKPHADIYLDDNAMRFLSWEQIGKQAMAPITAKQRKHPAMGSTRTKRMTARPRSRRMNIVMPMAGRGSRLCSNRVNTPKPLIDVMGRPDVRVGDRQPAFVAGLPPDFYLPSRASGARTGLVRRYPKPVRPVFDRLLCLSKA